MNAVVVPQSCTVRPDSAGFTELIRGPFVVGGLGGVADDLATRMVQLLKGGFTASPNATGALGGRGYSRVFEVEGLGRVFIKRYTHGGILRRLTGGQFLCVGPCRSKSEYLMLETVRHLGVSAPKPLVFVTKGSYLYSTWLVMEEIPNCRTLVEVSRDEVDLVPEVMDQLAQQLRILIKHRIFHVDLHPGNVLVSRDRRVSIVDFDKAYVYPGTASALCDLYLRRWRRAVIKHQLAPVLSEFMSLTLRSYHE
jgi:3-deoxy-D-manno-octulosonic acid kinase